jgi:hypothetical protein
MTNNDLGHEWDTLMRAPWGKPGAATAKANALEVYAEATVAFWHRRNMAVPTFHNEHEIVVADPIPSWVPKLAPIFGEFANDVRTLDGALRAAALFWYTKAKDAVNAYDDNKASVFRTQAIEAEAELAAHGKEGVPARYRDF